ncbi:hypothetical protein L6164_000711 [Bauhinia variegata]|uniref:Uncharacterized protein n=1 Tax=Bauhinia variegata TaxID=167791 RepID=A0ACB9Q6S8_BAUVA|nr:hypothetical protein L6164_000711 [Bauhinia variegata]
MVLRLQVARLINVMSVLDDKLSEAASSIDIATKQNLDNLVKLEEELLKKSASKEFSKSGFFEHSDQDTYEAILIRLARFLSEREAP